MPVAALDPTTDAAPQAVLQVDLPAIVENWRLLCRRHPSGAVAGVVKADGYGLGAGAVGRALAAAGCRHFFVAQLAEGLALRDALGAGPMIGVLGGFPPGADAGAYLVPVLNSLADLDAHAAAGRLADEAWPAILHLDTGMARLGLPLDELGRLAGDAHRLRGLDILYVMTHLACADTPAHPLNQAQRSRFAAACAALPAMPRSLANSAGIFLGPDFASDLARPGCALYGINPTPGQPNPMRQVMRLLVPVLQLREVAADVPVGYGASWTAPAPTRIATIAAGYADGYPRSLSNKGEGWFDGRTLPLLGRVSMDLITLDATTAPELRPGDMVEMMGPNLPPDLLAERAGTIGYEMLTSLGARYRRVYG
jgi:alanine racemase